MSALIVLGISLGVGLPFFWVASRRFARRRKSDGEWDDDGPLHPTPPPRNSKGNLFGSGLAYDLQHGLDRDEDWPDGRKPGSFEPPAT
ncbi:MAG: hypothetical protein HOQ11_02565 [Gemmatimonadaceae bacterium]|nr:hypothetical protein [Gemmatimonadaceae bacterium]NUQ92537.1 hypothetical protein [Gemmatimonadaceae bacterium]NUR32735.1 hypothetical protein [Gemmatimonadaceae bacterium]NUS96271.1 hypothetical protein [Gemmatimonadaceae bacterium]